MLAEIYHTLPEKLKHMARKEDIADAPDAAKRSYIPLETPGDQLSGDMYSPTGFTVDEIRALGPFPDYAALSGVPGPDYSGADFDLSSTTFRPYRPFRWAYHQTMALLKFEPNYWIELEKTYARRIRQRQDIYAKHTTDVLDALPGSELACRELMEMVLQFYCQRFPQFFSLSADRTTFTNSILGTTTDLAVVAPLHVLLDNCPEDFAVMLRDPRDGMYYFRAGVICSSLGWNVASKLGLQLRDVHKPVPDYKEKMQFSMDRYFAKKPTDKPIQRGSWGLEIDEPLYMPPGDPHEAYRGFQLEPAQLPLERINFRVDWQTLRRLPLTGAIVFNFKCVFNGVGQFRDEPRVPALCLRVLDGGKKHLMDYKATWHVEHVLKPALREWQLEQEDKGLVEAGWEAHTLDENPFFHGWQDKWRRGVC